jgi:glutathionylspermidine synthase
MDLASAIAIEIVGCHEAVIDTCSPLDFVHMKLPLQGWEMLPASWQDTVPFVLNSRGELIVGNIKQTKLFHYVEKNFLSKKILSRLEELASV